MADRIRFHLDEHVDPAIATALRRAGVNVTTTIESGSAQKTTKLIFSLHALKDE